jgi:hypothetical protein
MKYYPNAVLWWERYVKRMVQQLFQRVGTECKRDWQNLENFYEAIYDSLNARWIMQQKPLP